MEYLVTGATGFIGRFVVEELLKQPGSVVHALVRKGSEDKLERIRQSLGADHQQLRALIGDLTQPNLGIAAADLAQLKGSISQLYHLGAIYDLSVDAETQKKANVEGTRHALQAAEALAVECFQHVSSIAVAGSYEGLFTEAMFEEGTGFNNPYFLTKHLAEKCVREESKVPFRIYRPSVVVGHSKTGEMDKIDGPYFIIRLMEEMDRWLPEWLPLPGVECGKLNIVPVDFVARAIVHIAHQPDLEGQVFNITDDKYYSVADLFDLISGVSGLPTFRWKFSNRLTNRTTHFIVPKLSRFWPMRKVMESMDIAPAAINYVVYNTTFDNSNATRALQGSEISPPDLEQYLPQLWHYWKHSLSPLNNP
ncbi:MAG: SDR family oxidoreductase [Pseudomonadota bacterium]|nr:SDR family oxidoreductase [Pseudomonadota bacterium]